MKDIEFNCPSCGGSLVVDESGAGLSVDCPHCDKVIRIPSTRESKPAPKLGSSKTKKCPFCAEEILAEAKKCKFCGEFLDKQKTPLDPNQFTDDDIEKAVTQISAPKQNRSGATAAIIIILIVVAGFWGVPKYLEFQEEQHRLEKHEAVDRLIRSAQQQASDLNMQAISSHKARISMTKTDVRRSLGDPDSIRPETNPTLRAEIKENWDYGNGWVAFGWNDTVLFASDDLEYKKH